MAKLAPWICLPTHLQRHCLTTNHLPAPIPSMTAHPIIIQLTDTHGLKRSPILAAFQNRPRNPVFSLSNAGRVILAYVHAHMVSSTTIMNDWKLNRADMAGARRPKYGSKAGSGKWGDCTRKATTRCTDHP